MPWPSTNTYMGPSMGLRASLVAHMVKNRPAMRETWINPWVGKILWRRERLPTPAFWPKEFHGLYSPCGCKESDMTEWLSLHSMGLIVLVLGGRKAHTLKGNWGSWDPAFRTSAPATWDLTQLWGQRWPLSRKEPHLTLGSGSSTSFSSSAPYQSDNCLHTLRKDVTCVPAKSRSPNKAPGHR